MGGIPYFLLFSKPSYKLGLAGVTLLLYFNNFKTKESALACLMGASTSDKIK